MKEYNCILASLILLLATNLQAAPLYFQAGSNNATGTIDGVPFSGASWLLEIEVDDSLPPVFTGLSGPATDQWTRGDHQYTTTRLVINGRIYTLDLSGLKTGADNLVLYENRDLFIVPMGTGNILNTGAEARTYISPLVPDVADLGTVNTGVTIFDTGNAARFNNTSFISLTNVPSSGGAITIDQNILQGSGDFFVRASRTSIAAPRQIPTLGTMPSALMGLCILCAVGWIRRKRQYF